jgi:hypothetical protein
MSVDDVAVRDTDLPKLDAVDDRPARFGVKALTAVTVYLTVALWVTFRLWLNPSGRILAANRQDTLLFEWLIAHAAEAVAHGANPFTTHLMNMPSGLNLLANTSVLALAVPLAPLTLLAGPHLTFVTMLTGALAATASAWYLVLHRYLRFSRAAAFTAGLFCGFSPAMISQVTGHLHVAAQFLLPLIVLTVLRMRIPGRAVRTGLELAALVVLQVFISEEMLLLTAVALAVFIVIMWCLRPAAVRPHVAGALRACAVTTLVAGALLAYPLWQQFLGPMAYHGVPSWARRYGTDLAAFPGYATESLGGSPGSADHIAQGSTEENTFFGWGLLLLAAVAVVRLRRDATTVALAVTGGILALLSLGPEVNLHGSRSPVPGAWGLVDDLPVFDSVVPTRIGVLLTPILGLLLAISLDRLGHPADRGSARRLWLCAVAVALVPLTPTPATTAPRPSAPTFFTSGLWHRYLPADAVVVPVAPGWDENMDVMQWQLSTRLAFATTGGYFLAPVPDSADRAAIFGPVGRPTAALLVDAAVRGEPAAVTDDQRANAVNDVRFWQATTLVMRENAHGAAAVRVTVDRLFGAGVHVGDVWLWDVRDLRVPPG